MTPQALSAAFVAAYQYNKWCTGVMFWQYSSDSNGAIVSQSISSLLSLVGSSTNTTQTNITTPPTNTTTNTTNTTKTNTTATNTTNTTTTNTTQTNTTKTNTTVPSTPNSTNPFCLTFVSGICTNCSAGYYVGSNGVCTPANQICQTYNMLTGSCITCFAGYVLSGVTCAIPSSPATNGFCQTFASGVCTNCYQGYYIGSNGICTAVNQLCKTYSMATGSCLSCYSGYNLSGGTCA